MALTVTTQIERWPVDGSFIISRGAKTYVDIVVCTVSDGFHEGQGESTPIYYEGETAESCVGTIAGFANQATEFDRQMLLQALPRGAARNALDCALWDLQARKLDKPLWQVAKLPKPQPLISAYTISLGEPSKMEADARAAGDRHSLLKLKLSGDNDHERVVAVHRGAPNARLIVDANESWNDLDIAREAARLAGLGVELIEQPVSAGRDELLAGVQSPVPLCADESCHTAADIKRIAPYYDAVNIKLDKTGGLTAAIALANAAEAEGLKLMVGCMLSTSLGIRPAFALAQRARWVDLDGPLLLAKDRSDGFVFSGGMIGPK
ncbi:N-acetyl-D-Glu racemase DgcA [Parasphingorhabdus halotolerans]|uniref:Dipeptide epimerase n=1 Tax=Parasphingorhabdus halotolerans TaxID=2725558 RepID=A0A6H2DML4_9SPHN|nr:N-acetyl-D-Glu racemase DgcA [Parasphingorhabdus halotolerans]QJB69428.1 dipeptide epimerase [Parasphingorhabdus halotolerans]